MSDIVIKVEDLSKQYRLGVIGTGSIAHDVNRWWHTVRGKEDPYLKIGETNDRSFKGTSEYVWSLKDLNFEIKRGDAVGIIGRNGAGKSTLLKILSRVTRPTTGSLKIKGRIASLLEVGTGFHPELSGKENIYLNGAILGMKKAEVKSKFDEIVDFAGVERYIDTPVKRYSSGMYVRLAFAVAAHLEPEILIVDEVLAVGDAEFQKKCMGKLQDVNSQDGRTVLFVSHNLSAIRNLCKTGILLQNGKQIVNDNIESVIKSYLISTENISGIRKYHSMGKLLDRSGNQKVKFTDFCIVNSKDEEMNNVLTDEEFFLCFDLEVTQKNVNKVDIGFSVLTNEEVLVSIYYSSYENKFFDFSDIGSYRVKFKFNNFILAPGNFLVRGRILVNGEESDWLKITLGKIDVEMGDYYGTGQSGFISKNIILVKGLWDAKKL